MSFLPGDLVRVKTMEELEEVGKRHNGEFFVGRWLFGPVRQSYCGKIMQVFRVENCLDYDKYILQDRTTKKIVKFKNTNAVVYFTDDMLTKASPDTFHADDLVRVKPWRDILAISDRPDSDPILTEVCYVDNRRLSPANKSMCGCCYTVREVVTGACILMNELGDKLYFPFGTLTLVKQSVEPPPNAVPTISFQELFSSL